MTGRTHHSIRITLTEDVGAAAWPVWAAYGFSCVATLAISLLVMMRSGAMANPYSFSLLFLPVILSAFLGGGGPGMVATAIGAATIGLLAHYPPMTPIGQRFEPSFVIAFFACTGLLVSAFSEMLHRSRRKAAEALKMAMTQFETRRKMETSLKLIEAAFEQSHDGMVITETDGTIVAVNPSTCLISGYSPEELLGSSMRRVKSGRHDEAFYRAIFSAVAADGYWQGEIWNRRKSGEAYPQWLTISAVKDDMGKIINYVGTFTDVSQIKLTERKLNHQLNYDALTDLPNRLLLTSHLSKAVGRAKRDGCFGAALMVDIGQLKKVNDSLGHAAGDDLLQLAASRMLGRVRQREMLARHGGDAFVVVLENLDDPLQAAATAQDLIEALSQPFILDNGHEVCVSGCVGICVFPLDATDPAQILRDADTALHQAKAAGSSAYRFYTSALTDCACQRLELETRLRKALLQQEFVLHFQPLSHMADRRVTGAEALIRWADPVEGMIPPADFIPLAEETGLIVEVGAWVLRAACQQMMRWLQEGVEIETIAVNLSPRQFREPRLIDLVSRILAETGLPAHHLELEITEGALMENGAETIEKLTALKALGIRLAIDDFGTGYSSLAYLRHFPVDKLKVDQAFVRDLTVSQTDREIVAAVIVLGKALDLEVLAEGIETEEQFRLLMELGCDTAQGYLLGQPRAGASFATA